LQSESRWVLEGPREKLADIKDLLPPGACTEAGSGALVLDLVNSVGVLDLPHVGRPVELYTGKLSEGDFETLLADLTDVATSLPFAAGDPGTARYARGPAPREDVLYHVFVYLRYILSNRAPAGTRLVPALELIQRAPYRRWRTERREVGLDALTRVDEQTLLDLVTRAGVPAHSSSLSPAGAALASRLGGQLPEEVSERRIRATIDTPENRFVKAFIGQARGTIGRMRSEVAHRRNAFERNLLDDCEWMDAALTPIVRHSMWEEVGALARIPFSSTVLQRRRGYRDVPRHFARIRLAPRSPLDSREMQDLLELKDIATLYEMWTFFRVADLLCIQLGQPIRGPRPGRRDQFQVVLGRNQTFEWASGIQLAYNRAFAPPKESYSVGLRPDIALHLPGGPNAGLHLFDAKFRVRTRSGEGPAAAEGEEQTEVDERKGVFQGDDLYKMHTYRDAIPDAQSVWVLYPGGKFCFFHASGERVPSGSPEELPELIQGVGAIPFVPKPNGASDSAVHAEALATLRRLIGRERLPSA